MLKLFCLVDKATDTILSLIAVSLCLSPFYDLFVSEHCFILWTKLQTHKWSLPCAPKTSHREDVASEIEFSAKSMTPSESTHLVETVRLELSSAWSSAVPCLFSVRFPLSCDRALKSPVIRHYPSQSAISDKTSQLHFSERGSTCAYTI